MNQYDYDNKSDELELAWNQIEQACNNNVKAHANVFFDKLWLLLAAWKLPQENARHIILNTDILTFNISKFLFELLHVQIQNSILQDIQVRTLNAQCSSAFFSDQKETDDIKVEEIEEAEELEKTEDGFSKTLGI